MRQKKALFNQITFVEQVFFPLQCFIINKCLEKEISEMLFKKKKLFCEVLKNALKLADF